MTAPGSQPQRSRPFFDQLRASGFERNPSGGPLGGVCSGLAVRLGVSTNVVRLLFVVLFMLGIGVVVYGVCWLLLPDRSGQIELEDFLVNGKVGSGLIGACLAILLGTSGLGAVSYSSDNQLLLGILVVTAVVVAMIIYRAHLNQGEPPAAAPDRPRVSLIKTSAPITTPVTDDLAHDGRALTRLSSASSSVGGVGIALGEGYGRYKAPLTALNKGGRPRVSGRVSAAAAGLALISSGLFAVLSVIGIQLPEPGAVFWAVISGLVLIGLFTLAAGLRGKRGGGLIGLSLVALLATSLVATQPGHRSLVQTVRDRIEATGGSLAASPHHWTLSGPLTKDQTFQADLGDATLDLTAVAARPAGEPVHTLTIGASVGTVEVLVPSDLTVEIEVGDEVGTFTVNGQPVPADHLIGPAKPKPDLRLVGDADVGAIAVKQVTT